MRSLHPAEASRLICSSAGITGCVSLKTASTSPSCGPVQGTFLTLSTSTGGADAPDGAPDEGGSLMQWPPSIVYASIFSGLVVFGFGVPSGPVAEDEEPEPGMTR